MPIQDIATLNKKLGAPGRIAFREGPAGYPLVALAESHGACEVALYGGHVLSYRPVGHAPVLWMARSLSDVKPGQAIRGGIPVCWPWFGPHPEGGDKPMHGIARTRPWHLAATEYDSKTTALRLTLDDDDSTRAIWPHAFHLELHVTVDTALRVELTTTNTDAKPVVLTQALHSYFSIRQIMDISIRGLEGARYADRLTNETDVVQDGPLVIRGETDRVYPDTASECVIADPGIGRNIVIRKRGSRSTVTWNPWIEKSKRLPDLAPEDYLRFVCVETTNADRDAVRLEPGQKHTLAVTLRADLRAE